MTVLMTTSPVLDWHAEKAHYGHPALPDDVAVQHLIIHNCALHKSE